MILILFCCLEKVIIVMNTWMIGKFNEKSLPKKEEFLDNLNLESITDSDYNHEKESAIILK